MEKIKDDEIILYNEEGEEHLMKILFTYENEKRNKEYVFVFEESKPEDIYCMSYTEDNELFEITDEEELKEAEEVLNCFLEDENIQNIK